MISEKQIWEGRMGSWNQTKEGMELGEEGWKEVCENVSGSEGEKGILMLQVT